MASITIDVDTEIRKAKKDIDSLTDSVDDLNEATKDGEHQSESFGDGISSLMGRAASAAGAIVAFGAAVTQGFAWAEEGAALDTAREKFDRLAESIGTTGDALLIDLQRATSGLRSDADLVAGAVDLMSLGLATTHDEAVRLARVVGALDMDMNALTLTLTNKTTARFDTLNVAVAGFDETMQELIDTGMDADAAFSEAFLRQAEAQIEKVGDAADSSSANFDRLRASWANATNEAKKNLIPVFSDLASVTADYLDNVGEASNDTSKLYLAFPPLYSAIVTTKAVTGDLADETKLLGRETIEAAAAVVESDKALMNHRTVIKQAADAQEDYNLKEGEYLKIVADVGKELENFTDKQEDLTKKRDEAQKKLDTLIKQGWWQESAAVQDAKSKLDEYNEALAENAEEYEMATNRRILARTQEILAADGLSQTEEKALLQMGLNMGVYTDEYVAQAEEIISKSQEMADRINAIPSEKHINFFLKTHGAAPVAAGGQQDFRVRAGMGFANGTNFAPGGAALVGERGPEIVNLPRGSQVIPNHKIGGNINVTLVYSPTMSLGTKEEAENILLPFVEQGIRNAQRNNLL